MVLLDSNGTVADFTAEINNCASLNLKQRAGRTGNDGIKMSKL